MKKAWVVVVTAVTTGAASIGFGEGWSFQAGPVYRNGMEMKLSGATYSSSQGSMYMPGANYSTGINEWQRGARPDDFRPPTDDISRTEDRGFDDGFVNVSPPTDPTGQTWYWGYSANSQYNPVSQTLTFTRQTTAGKSGQYTDVGFGTEVRTSAEVQEDREASAASDFNGHGFFAEASYELFRDRSWTVEAVVGMSYVEGGTTLEDETYLATVTQRNYANTVVNAYSYDMSQSFVETYAYHDGNNIVGLVPAPYAGTYDGPGPLLSSELPESYAVASSTTRMNEHQTSSSTSQRMTGERTWTLHNRVAVDADVDDTALNVGARAGFLWGDRVSLFVQPDLSVHYVSVDMKRTEELYQTAQDGTSDLVASWTDSATDEAWVMGVGASVGTEVALPQGCFVAASVGYEWMLDKPEFDVGPSSIEVDLSSMQASASVGARF